MATKKLGTLGIILLAVSVVGLILAIVGICVPYFSVTLGKLSNSYGLFAVEKYTKPDFPVAAVQAFSLIALICTAACVALTVLNVLGVVKLGFIVKAIVAGATVVIALLAIIFAGVYVGQLKWDVGAGAYLLFFGSVIGAVPAVLAK